MPILDGRPIIQAWKDNHETIATLFHERKYQEAKQPVIYYTNQLILVLEILNDAKDHVRHMNLDRTLAALPHAPFNSHERIPFILEQPEQYHCYIQLNELYKETEKLYAKVEILNLKK